MNADLAGGANGVPACRLGAGTLRAQLPIPGVAEPERRKQVQSGGFRSAVEGGDADGNIFDVSLGILDENVEVAVAGEDASIEEFVLRVVAAAAAALRDQRGVGVLGLR